MVAYQYGHCTIASNVALPELPRAGSGSDTVTFVRLQPRTRLRAAGDCFHEWKTPQGDVYASFLRVSSGYTLHFTGRAIFRVSADLASVRCVPSPGTSGSTIRHLFLDVVMPLVLSLAGRHVLHASAVEHEGAAVMFVGSSGDGKSTLASILAEGGSRVLADDAVVVEERDGEFFARPTYPSLRLWPDSARALSAVARGRPPGRRSFGRKRLLAESDRLRFCDRPVPITHAYLLDTQRGRHTAPAIISPIARRDAVISLIRHSFTLGIADRQTLNDQFALMSRLAARRRFYRLRVARDLRRLASVRDVVRAHIAGLPASGLLE